jgi:predicted TPR repeat methyltransferase
MVVDNQTLDKVYSAENHEELMDAYKDWAVNYDADTVGEFGYEAHINSAKALDKALEDKSANIMDAGCGTGLVAEILQDMGYKHMDGLDYSKEMLDEAEKKGVYKNLYQRDLSKPLDFPDNAYDAVVCTGTFTYGHVDANGFDELARITRPGGVICFTVREGAYEEYGYRKRMIELEQKNVWELLTMCDETYFSKENGGVTCKMCTYKVLDGAAS